MSIQDIMLKATYGILAIVGIGLLVASIIVRNTSIIFGKPLVFVAELVAMSIVTALPLYAFILTRKISFKTANKFVLLFAIKLAVMHVLLELSGFYEYMFSSTSS